MSAFVLFDESLELVSLLLEAVAIGFRLVLNPHVDGILALKHAIDVITEDFFQRITVVSLVLVVPLFDLLLVLHEVREVSLGVFIAATAAIFVPNVNVSHDVFLSLL